MMRKRLGACLIVFAVGIAACSFGTSGEPSTGVDAATSNTNPTPVCGDGVCSALEARSCPQDCGPGGNGSGSGSGSCGDGVCQATESTTSCPSDCPTTATCGDGICQATETNATCPSDCTTSGGPIDCADQATMLSCLFCEAGLGCAGPPVVDAAACMAAGC